MRYYGVRLSDVEAGREDALEVAHMIAHVPAGSAVYEWIGGELAMTDEVSAIRELNFTVAQVNSTKKLTRPAPPEGIRSRERKRDQLSRNVRAFKKRRAQRVQQTASEAQSARHQQTTEVSTTDGRQDRP